MTETLKKLSPIHIYLLCSLVYGAILSMCSIVVMTQATKAEILFFFSSSFFLAFLLAFNGQRSLRLMLLSIILAVFSTLSFVWPIGTMWVSIPSQCLTLAALISACILLSVYHREKSLIPSYDTFFNEVWTKAALFLLVTLFCIGMLIIVTLFISIFNLLGITFIRHLLQDKIVLSFLASFTIIIGLYICQQSERILLQFKDILVRFSVIFFSVIATIAWLFIIICFIRTLSDGHILVSKKTYIYTLFWFCFFNLIFFNGAFWFYHRAKNKLTKSMRLLRFLLLSFPFLGLTLTSLMFGAFYIYTYDLVTSSHGFEYYWVSENNFIEYIVFSLLWLYYALYTFGKLITREEFFSNWLPKVNLVMAVILIVSTWGLINPISSSFLSLEKVESLPYLPQQASLKKPENALTGTNLTWISNSDQTSPIVLGVRDRKKLYACQVSIAHNLVNGESVDGDHCVVNYDGRDFIFKHYKLLSGKGPLLWASSNYYKDYRLIRGTFLKDPLRALPLCRTIYKNQIYIGHSQQGYWNCQIIVRGKAVSAPGLQLLYAKIK